LHQSTPALAQLLSTTLYYKRFFPYYTFNVVGGVDADGRGCVFTYDAIGSFERVMYASSGSGSLLVQPVLDSQAGFKNQEQHLKRSLTVAEAVDLVKDVITSAGERDIYTGDFVDIYIITATEMKKDRLQLRLD
jgi:20S proteasome subunit beta 6